MPGIVAGMEFEIEVEAPPARPWGRLVDVATELTESATSDGTVNRRDFGLTFVPFGCDGLRTGRADCDATTLIDPADPDDPADYDVDDKSGAIRTLDDAVEAYSFLMVDGLTCSTLSGPGEYLTNRLIGHARTLASDALARELIAGDASGSASLSSTAAVVTPASTDPINVFAALEDHLASTLHGGQGIIHMAPSSLVIAVNSGYVSLRNGVLMTIGGHLVSADSGYVAMQGPDGEAAPGAGEQWVYASGPVWYQTTVPRLLGSQRQFDAHNDFQLLAEAHGIVVFEPCPVGAALLALTSAA